MIRDSHMVYVLVESCVEMEKMEIYRSRPTVKKSSLDINVRGSRTRFK